MATDARTAAYDRPPATPRPGRPPDPRQPLRRRLGELLLDEGVLDERQLSYALQNQLTTDGRRERLGQTVVRLGFVSEQAVARALAHQLGLEYLEDGALEVDDAVAALIPSAIAERHRILPLRRDDGTLVVACTDPTDVVALDDVRLASGSRRIRAVVCTPSVLTGAIRAAYGFEGRASELVEAITADTADAELDDLGALDDGPVVRLAEGILAEALGNGCSDVHIEPGPDETAVRYRIDGVLQQVMSVPRTKAGALVSRLKLMAAMDIAERRRPQDGRATFRTGGQEVDLRVSSLPSLHGETIVIRLLRKGAERLSLTDVGFDDATLPVVLAAVERPQGLVLLTGPTGSGKTSTLYGFLAHLAGEAQNIITLEDPVEYELRGVNQTQINDRIGFTFAKALRTVLRQDPDVVMVGEVRDPETAELALQAALTGHLVFSTLHTNTASGAVVRLRDLGIPNYLVSSALSLVIAQRLARRVCPACAVSAAPSERLLSQLGLTPADVDGVTFRVGAGCGACGQSGYRGRTGVFEVLPVDGAVRELLSSGAGEGRIRQAARMAGMRSLREDGLRLAREGVTTLEEILRVTPADLTDSGTCPVCAQSVEPEFSLCPWCGVHLRPDACGACESPLELGWRVCPKCGTPVPEVEAPGGHRHRPTILVTDDDPVVLATATAMLEQDFEVVQAAGAVETLEVVQRVRPDALLLDVQLPDGDGREVLAQLRRRPATAELPVLLMTADTAWVQQASGHPGGDGVLAKPFSREGLLVRLHQLLRADAS